MRGRMLFIIVFSSVFACVSAQGSFDDFRKRAQSEFDAFRKKSEENYRILREKADREYAMLVENAWKEYSAIAGIQPPKEKPVVPVKFDDKSAPEEDRKLTVEKEQPVPVPQPRPEPIVPVPVPVPETPQEESPERVIVFTFYGLDIVVEWDDKPLFKLKSVDEKDIAEAWKALGNERYNRLLATCFEIRDTYKLCDWAYIQLLNRLAEFVFDGSSCNESTLLAAYLYAHSGYNMRLAKSNGRLYMLYASEYIIYSKNYWNIDGKMYYMYDGDVTTINVCEACYPQEQSLSMMINDGQLFAQKDSRKRQLRSKRYSDASGTVYTNENLIDFFNSYPSAGLGQEKWVTYANTPMSEEVRTSLYPTLAKALRGKSELESVNYLLDFVQTAFVYEYDDKVWGYDRVFFSEETLYYPYADCEDRSILFSRLVRDLLGLDVVLLYYPGHLAAAVLFSERQQGDYVSVGNKNYLVCDPTYINAPAGKTMPQVVDKPVTVIMLN